MRHRRKKDVIVENITIDECFFVSDLGSELTLSLTVQNGGLKLISSTVLGSLNIEGRYVKAETSLGLHNENQ